MIVLNDIGPGAGASESQRPRTYLNFYDNHMACKTHAHSGLGGADWRRLPPHRTGQVNQGNRRGPLDQIGSAAYHGLLSVAI